MNKYLIPAISTLISIGVNAAPDSMGYAFNPAVPLTPANTIDASDPGGVIPEAKGWSMEYKNISVDHSNNSYDEYKFDIVVTPDADLTYVSGEPTDDILSTTMNIGLLMIPVSTTQDLSMFDSNPELLADFLENNYIGIAIGRTHEDGHSIDVNVYDKVITSDGSQVEIKGKFSFPKSTPLYALTNGVAGVTHLIKLQDSEHKVYYPYVSKDIRKLKVNNEAAVRGGNQILLGTVFSYNMTDSPFIINQ
ncbi:hypothetical protein V9N52_004330 [Vibrio navarrensis]